MPFMCIQYTSYLLWLHVYILDILVQVGRILDRDSKKCKATVEVVYNRQVLTVDYDNICEYIGDIDDL